VTAVKSASRQIKELHVTEKVESRIQDRNKLPPKSKLPIGNCTLRDRRHRPLRVSSTLRRDQYIERLDPECRICALRFGKKVSGIRMNVRLETPLCSITLHHLAGALKPVEKHAFLSTIDKVLHELSNTKM